VCVGVLGDRTFRSQINVLFLRLQQVVERCSDRVEVQCDGNGLIGGGDVVLPALPVVGKLDMLGPVASLVASEGKALGELVGKDPIGPLRLQVVEVLVHGLGGLRLRNQILMNGLALRREMSTSGQGALRLPGLRATARGLRPAHDGVKLSRIGARRSRRWILVRGLLRTRMAS